MDIQDYSKELQQNAKEFKQYAFEYKKERALYAEALTKLTEIIYKTGLSEDKASFENKFSKLLGTEYKDFAQNYIKQFYNSHANYKGWEMVLEAYKAQISATQSVIKYNLTGEINTNLVNKTDIERIY